VFDGLSPEGLTWCALGGCVRDSREKAAVLRSGQQGKDGWGKVTAATDSQEKRVTVADRLSWTGSGCLVLSSTGCMVTDSNAWSGNGLQWNGCIVEQGTGSVWSVSNGTGCRAVDGSGEPRCAGRMYWLSSGAKQWRAQD
jgi:hypothetical protein